MPVPQIIPVTPAEKLRYREAQERRKRRMSELAESAGEGVSRSHGR
jgi:hypothetical protein